MISVFVLDMMFVYYPSSDVEEARTLDATLGLAIELHALFLRHNGIVVVDACSVSMLVFRQGILTSFG
jgi:hypothetical protein